MTSSELVVGVGRHCSVSNVALSSLSVLGNVVPPTFPKRLFVLYSNECGTNYRICFTKKVRMCFSLLLPKTKQPLQ